MTQAGIDKSNKNLNLETCYFSISTLEVNSNAAMYTKSVIDTAALHERAEGLTEIKIRELTFNKKVSRESSEMLFDKLDRYNDLRTEIAGLLGSLKEQIDFSDFKKENLVNIKKALNEGIQKIGPLDEYLHEIEKYLGRSKKQISSALKAEHGRTKETLQEIEKFIDENLADVIAKEEMLASGELCRLNSSGYIVSGGFSNEYYNYQDEPIPSIEDAVKAVKKENEEIEKEDLPKIDITEKQEIEPTQKTESMQETEPAQESEPAQEAESEQEAEPEQEAELEQEVEPEQEVELEQEPIETPVIPEETEQLVGETAKEAGPSLLTEQEPAENAAEQYEAEAEVKVDVEAAVESLPEALNHAQLIELVGRDTISVIKDLDIKIRDTDKTIAELEGQIKEMNDKGILTKIFSGSKKRQLEKELTSLRHRQKYYSDEKQEKLVSVRKECGGVVYEKTKQTPPSIVESSVPSVKYGKLPSLMEMALALESQFSPEEGLRLEMNIDVNNSGRQLQTLELAPDQNGAYKIFINGIILGTAWADDALKIAQQFKKGVIPEVNEEEYKYYTILPLNEDYKYY